MQKLANAAKLSFAKTSLQGSQSTPVQDFSEGQVRRSTRFAVLGKASVKIMSYHNAEEV
jgi:hypothetical protein